MPRQTCTVVGRLIGGTIMLLACLSLAALGLHAWRLHRVCQVSSSRALEAVVELGSAQIAEAAGGGVGAPLATDGVLKQFQRWSWAAMRQPGVLGTALLDGRGDVLGAVPADLPMARIAGGRSVTRESTSLQQLPGGGQPRSVQVVTRPLDTAVAGGPAGGLVLLADRTQMPLQWGRWLLLFALPLAGIAAISFSVGLRWLRSSIHKPLRTFVRKRWEDEDRWMARLPTERRDELGEIARTMEKMARRIQDAREELDQSRRQVDSRVARETEKMRGLLATAQKQRWVDPLTGLGNRRLLEDRLDPLFAAARCGGGDLTVVMFDIDHFKPHNDTHGHAAGDDLLRFLGELLRGGLRKHDVAIRYGGDEFVLLLPDIRLEDASGLTDRIVRLFGQYTSRLPTQPAPTLSAGVASVLSSGAASGAELLAQADAALYLAKNGGRNGLRVRRQAEHTAGSPVAAAR